MYRDDTAKIIAKAYRQGFDAGYALGHGDGFDECAEARARDSKIDKGKIADILGPTIRDERGDLGDQFSDQEIAAMAGAAPIEPNMIKDRDATQVIETLEPGDRVMVGPEGSYIIGADGSARPLGTPKGCREL